MFRRAQYTHWQIRLFPLDFRRDIHNLKILKRRDILWRSVLGHGIVFLRKTVSFEFSSRSVRTQCGGKGLCSKEQLLTQPLNSAVSHDRRSSLLVSCDPPGCGSEGCYSCTSGAMLSPWRTGREIADSLDSFHAVPAQRLSFPIFMIDKCFIPRHFCRTVAGKGHTLLNLTQKDTESG